MFDAKNFFDDPNSRIAPYKQSSSDSPSVRRSCNRTFFFADYEGLRISRPRQSRCPPTDAQRAGDFSDQLDLTQQTGTDCLGHPTFVGEIFDARNAGNGCGVAFQYDGAGMPLNIIPQNRLDPLALAFTALYPEPNVNGNGFNNLTNPVRQETRNNFDVRIDQKYTEKDYGFFRFSYEDQPSVIPGPFDTTGGDGGGFFSGDEDNAYRSFATSWTHLFRNNLTNEFRLGYNRVNSQRQQINADKTSEELLNFPGGFPGFRTCLGTVGCRN